MTKHDIQKRLRQDLFTICDHFDIEMADRIYTEKEYQNLKRTLLTLNELGMDQTQMNRILAIGA